MSEFRPTALNNPPNAFGQEWWRWVWAAWSCSAAGDVPQALKIYEYADSLIDGYELNPSLSVLRHSVGEGSGSVTPVPATERDVCALFLPAQRHDVKQPLKPVARITEENIERFIGGVSPGHHLENIKTPRRHVMVLSTGRCGTMSLYKLFGGNLTPYHTYWFMVHPVARWEMMCRLAENNHDNCTAAAQWACTRAAEWLGERPMMGLNHADTVFAPVFAAIHPEARFVYLRRDPEKVLESFCRKGQWSGGNNHFRPVSYDFEGGFRLHVPPISDADGSKFHIEYTEDFSRTFGGVMGDRFMEISSDRLFAQDREEIARLLEFTGSDIDLEFAVEHFSTKINEKAHKCRS